MKVTVKSVVGLTLCAFAFVIVCVVVTTALGLAITARTGVTQQQIHELAASAAEVKKADDRAAAPPKDVAPAFVKGDEVRCAHRWYPGETFLGEVTGKVSRDEKGVVWHQVKVPCAQAREMTELIYVKEGDMVKPAVGSTR